MTAGAGYAADQPQRAGPPAGQWVEISRQVLAGLAARGRKIAWPGQTAGIAVDRTTGDVFMVVPGQGLWKSGDRAATFARVDGGQVGGRCETGFALNPDPAGRRLACFMLDGPSGYTLDGGRTWQGMTGMGRGWDCGSVGWSAQRPRHIFALRHESDGEVYTSPDLGKTWQLRGKGFAAVGLLSATTFVATKEKEPGIFRSTDSAASWQKVSPLEPGGRDIRILHGTAYWTSAKGLLASRDRGQTWFVEGQPVECSYGPYFGKDDRQMVVVGKQGFFQTRDGGGQWRPVVPLPPGFSADRPGWFLNFGWDPQADIFYALRMGLPAYKYVRGESARSEPHLRPAAVAGRAQLADLRFQAAAEAIWNAGHGQGRAADLSGLGREALLLENLRQEHVAVQEVGRLLQHVAEQRGGFSRPAGLVQVDGQGGAVLGTGTGLVRRACPADGLLVPIGGQ